MRRVLLAIGCDQYDYLASLSGAEYDARRIFSELIKEDVGNYDPNWSKLLLSPTLSELAYTIEKILFSAGSIDTLTLFFAGHGEMHGVGFILCVRDTRGDQLTATGYWLSRLFALMADAAPAQTNVVLDACRSGGLTVDLSVLTKAEVMGDAGSPAVTLLAMSARNQDSMEGQGGGVGTNALLDCISGQAFVQDSTSALDLMDIGKVVAERVARELGQNPCLSALNVHHRSIFCKNPHYQASAQSAFSRWEPRAFLNAVEPVLASHSHSPRDLIADVERLTSGLIERARGVPDQFREAEVRATAIVSMLEYCGTWSEVDSFVIDQARLVCDQIHNALEHCVEAIERSRFALLSRSGHLGDLFYLPVRISKILGWSGAAFHLDRAIDRSPLFPARAFGKLLTQLIDHYAPSVSVMSDAQGPYIAIALTAAREVGFVDNGETLLSLLFSSVVASQGRLADAHLEPEKVLRYLVARHEQNFDEALSLIARPSETITVLLKAAALYGLEEVFDESLEDLDHVTINAYVTDNYQMFAKRSMEGGENAGFMIGHGIWRIDELEAAWPQGADQEPANRAVVCGAILSALLFPDRVPWFVFAKRDDSNQLQLALNSPGH